MAGDYNMLSIWEQSVWEREMWHSPKPQVCPNCGFYDFATPVISGAPIISESVFSLPLLPAVEKMVASQDPPRARPASAVEDYDEIFKSIRKIAKEENRQPTIERITKQIQENQE